MRKRGRKKLNAEKVLTEEPVRRCLHCKSVVGLQVNTPTRQLNEVEKLPSTAPGVGKKLYQVALLVQQFCLSVPKLDQGKGNHRTEVMTSLELIGLAATFVTERHRL